MSDYDEYLIESKDGSGKCFMCGKETRYIDISFETWLCSEECQRDLDEEYYEAVIKSID